MKLEQVLIELKTKYNLGLISKKQYKNELIRLLENAKSMHEVYIISAQLNDN